MGEAVRRSASVGEPQLYVATPTMRGEVLRLAVPLGAVYAAVGQAQRQLLGVGLAALVFGAALSLGLSYAATRPLHKVGRVARAMAAGDLSRRVHARGGDEIGEVANALDTLADELQRRLVQLEGERGEMQALIDSMAEGVLALDREGTVRRANPAACRIFGLTGEVRGTPAPAVSRRPAFLELVRTTLQGAPVPATELAHGQHHLLATAQPLADGGAVLVFLDVSTLRRLQDVRRDFVANASHELKTPLTAIRGYSETLLDPELPPELRRQFTETVQANAERLQRIVDDLLDLSRIESGGWRAEPEPVAVDQVARAAWANFAAAAEEKGVGWEIEGEELPQQVLADPGALHQIFANLFSNALRFTPAGGRITIAARAAAQRAGWTRVEVRDTGAGIPAVHLPRIFERFYRVDPARSREEGGTGLGLAIVRHLVEAHGGSVEAESSLGQGTTIRFVLPTRPTAQPVT
ncbi:MAG: HAMP domain-containing protein [Gemmatimonadetes bacterium]|nr:HAMP domain-containing protein [Gemmatimonadota bacterium]